MAESKREYGYTPVSGREEMDDNVGVVGGGEEESSPLTSAGVAVKTELVPASAVIASKMVSADTQNGGGGIGPPAAADRRFLYIAACVANMASFICGVTFGWTSPEIPKFNNPEETPLSQPLTSSEEGWVGSFLPLAAAIGPFAGGFMVDRIGRKKTLLVATIPFIAAFFLNIAPANVNYLYLSRFLCGLSVGSVFTVIPMYIGEIADDETRGPLGSFMQLFIVIGLLFSYGLGPYLSIKLFNIILLGPPVAFLVFFFLFIPESPYYLIKAKDEEGAEEALSKLRGKSKDAVRKEIEAIRNLVEEAEANKASFFDIFKSKGLTMALFLSVSLVACQQLSGINIILFYAQGIFTDAGVSLAPEICTIIIGIVQIAASATTPIMEQRFGKRFLLMLSGIGMGLSQGVLAYFFHLKDGGSDVSNIGWIPIACLVVYIITYCLGFGPLPWAVMGELFPGNIKSAASTVTASGCWVLGFILTKYFSIVAEIIGKDGSFGFFAGCCFVAAVFTYKLVPETSGKSFQEIQDILNGTNYAKSNGDVNE